LKVIGYCGGDEEMNDHSEPTVKHKKTPQKTTKTVLENDNYLPAYF